MSAKYIESFLSRVEKTDTCWIWRGAVDIQSGYGYAYWHIKGSGITAQRVAYTLFIGPIPDGLEVHHKCHVKLCVNPKHLGLLTPTANKKDQKPKGTHCKHGHPLVETNLYMYDGYRSGCKYCRYCRATRFQGREPKSFKEWFSVR